MRRLTAYLAGSVSLATSVVLWAFMVRPNFYSAAVYLSQSNACLMILSNLSLICVGSFMYGLEQLLFGPLRPAEIEQLYERGWFAITEWLFAMSTFRDEFGFWFLTMFTALFIGKVWGWIAEGRIETLEQQPPANPRLFHTRLVASLALYALFAMQMFWYCADMVVYEARPGVMVMFVFEFAIIFISAISTILRYMLWWEEHRIIAKQTKQKLKERREQIRVAREQARQGQDAQAQDAEAQAGKALPNNTTPDAAPADAARADDVQAGRADSIEEEIDEDDIEVPGWESKGGWLFALDIGTDLLKLVAYMAFFTILTVFYGIPIYIIRDMYLTLRSFSKRVSDYVKYQKATRDMNLRYPDATAEELSADNTCIVCREEMRPWPQPGAAPAMQSIPERNRPKKLPCGHILHFGCLRSWLERQQVCPICRRSVLAQSPTGATPGNQNANNPLFGNGAPRVAPGAPNAPPNRGQRRGFRRFQLGPFRLEFGRPDNEAFRNLLHQLHHRRQNNRQVQVNPRPEISDAANSLETQLDMASPGFSQLRQGLNTAVANAQLTQFEQHLQREFQALSNTRYRVDLTRALFRELERARTNPEQVPPVVPPWQPTMQMAAFPSTILGANTSIGSLHRPSLQPITVLGQHGAPLPEGLVLPPGYQAVPLGNAGLPALGLRNGSSSTPTINPDLITTSVPVVGVTTAGQAQGSRQAMDTAIATSIADIASRTEQAIAQSLQNTGSGSAATGPSAPAVAHAAVNNPLVAQQAPLAMAPGGLNVAPALPSIAVQSPTQASVTSPSEQAMHSSVRADTVPRPSVAPFAAEQPWSFPPSPPPLSSNGTKEPGVSAAANGETGPEAAGKKAHQPTVEDERDE